MICSIAATRPDVVACLTAVRAPKRSGRRSPNRPDCRQPYRTGFPAGCRPAGFGHLACLPKHSGTPMPKPGQIFSHYEDLQISQSGKSGQTIAWAFAVIRFLRTAIEREDRNRDRLRQTRQDHKEAEAGIARLLELVEKELMDTEDASMRKRLVNLRFRRDELHHRPPDLRQADARLLLNEVRVNDREIRISGSKAVLARRAAGAGQNHARDSLFCSRMAHPRGFEPLASAFGGQRSIQLSYGCVVWPANSFIGTGQV